MVVDAGGGTVDITIHKKMKTDGCLTEIHKPSGGCRAGEFEKMLELLLGTQYTDSIRNTDSWFSVLDSFEV
jgi:hypothetical protein